MPDNLLIWIVVLVVLVVVLATLTRANTGRRRPASGSAPGMPAVRLAADGSPAPSAPTDPAQLTTAPALPESAPAAGASPALNVVIGPDHHADAVLPSVAAGATHAEDRGAHFAWDWADVAAPVAATARPVVDEAVTMDVSDLDDYPAAAPQLLGEPDPSVQSDPQLVAPRQSDPQLVEPQQVEAEPVGETEPESGVPEPVVGADPEAGAAAEPVVDEAPEARAVSEIHEVMDGGYGWGSAAPTHDGAMPLGHPVKANWHWMTFQAPGDPWYDQITPDVWFTDGETARRNGFSHS